MRYHIPAKKKLAQAAAFSLLLGCTSLHTVPALAAPEADTEAAAQAGLPYDVVDIAFDGKTFATLHIYHKGEVSAYNDDGIKNLKERTATRDLFPGELDGIREAMKYWHAVIGDPKKGAPIINYIPQDNGEDNHNSADAISLMNNVKGNLATAMSRYFKDEGDDSTAISAAIDSDAGTELNPWTIAPLNTLWEGGMNGDFPGTIVHEMFHALGASTNIDTTPHYKLGTTIAPKDYIYEEAEGKLSGYDLMLRDYKGHSLLNDDGQLRNITYLASVKDIPADGEDFYVVKGIAHESNGGVYLTGTNIEAVRTNNGTYADDDDANIAWPDGEGEYEDGVGAVPGLPVNCFEKDDKDKTLYSAELSHYELQNSLQSHQNYRTWCVPMEMELALLQDLGYNIDRKKFFGNSLYVSNCQGDYAYTNSTGYNETQANGIGFHLYGSNDEVTQTAHIYANGAYGIGIRTDGTNNKLTINNTVTVEASGDHGRAINITYGKENTVTINKGASIVANGANGQALSFDFGDNEMGNNLEYRGSYLDVEYKEDTNSWVPYYQTDDLKNMNLYGELVTKADIAGTLEATGKDGDAIYIGRTAYVKDINLNEGAYIRGNITSDWGNFTGIYKGIKLQDGTEAASHPTNLNVNTDLTFVDNIYTYNDNLKLNLAAGKTFSLNGGMACLAEINGASGTFVNKGILTTSIAEGKNTQLTINSKLVNDDGAQVVFAENVLDGTYGTINATGNVEGKAKIVLDQNSFYGLGSSYDQADMDQYFQKDGAAGSWTKLVDQDNLYKKGLVKGAVQDGILTFSVNKDIDSIEMNNTRADALEALDNNIYAGYSTLSAVERSNLNSFAYQNSSTLGESLEQYMGSNVPTTASMVQQNSTISNVLGARMLQTTYAANIPLTVPMSNFVDGSSKGITMHVPVEIEPDSGLWLKFSRNWSNFDGGSSNACSTGNTFTIGQDRKLTPGWRMGAFFSYGKSSFGASGVNNKLADYRLGLYSGFSKGLDEGYVYLDYGWQRNDLQRHVNLAWAMLRPSSMAASGNLAASTSVP